MHVAALLWPLDCAQVPQHQETLEADVFRRGLSIALQWL